MPILNFKKQYVERILAGIKTTTIRQKRKYPIKPGDRLYLYTGLRTKNTIKLGEAVCSGVFKIKIEDFASSYILVYNGIVLINNPFQETVALRDGFNNYMEMVKFFRDQYTLPFEGDLIEWKELIK